MITVWKRNGNQTNTFIRNTVNGKLTVNMVNTNDCQTNCHSKNSKLLTPLKKLPHIIKNVRVICSRHFNASCVRTSSVTSS